jgi:hypothetical protein
MRHLLLAAFCIAIAAQPPTHNVTLVAGEGLKEPFAIDFDTRGNLYIAEMGGQGVSVIDKAGKVTKLAGTGEPGLSGDGGPAASARLNNPHHLLMAPDAIHRRTAPSRVSPARVCKAAMASAARPRHVSSIARTAPIGIPPPASSTLPTARTTACSALTRNSTRG